MNTPPPPPPPPLTTMSDKTEASVVDKFPHPTLPHVSGDPSYKQLAEIKRKLNTNTASVASTFGDVNAGHLRTTLTNAEYKELTKTTFVPPALPGQYPALSKDTTKHEFQKSRFNEQLRIWKQHDSVEKALKQQVLGTFEEVYYSTLCDKLTGYARVTTRALLEHLFAAYGKITHNDLNENDALLREPCNPAMPIETYYKQVEEAVDFALAANDPYSERHIVNISVLAMQRTGVFSERCKEWKKQSDKDKTWPNFKGHFSEAQGDYRNEQTTAKQGGCAGSLTIDEIRDKATSVSLAATSSQRAELEANNTMLRKQVQTYEANYQALKDKVDQLQNNRYAPPPVAAITASHGGGAATTVSNVSNLPSPNKKPRQKRYPNDNFCWSHCYNVAKTHTSATCMKKEPGHKDDATKDNTMGGSGRNKNGTWN